ncbi:hypothetical protein predicted by Glimmer/Critica [Sorangium cellulosum So ce56]|uniref:SEC-C motif-containing protein n=1 Tax=Sorangium cellulosum (strain So ce56) TaxID=448385 RepID=A9FBD0_SORC5|nr:SEC-C metal-binding domain-containing protein [Sorangium cellulosum]CAN98000.1 hypothetical protein predicted by Glimmer/Critica [Sorangium cellulosum So ce56]
MGHQHHFLSRLDRVSLPHVELALTLYRDHGLVQYLLGCVKLPDGAERVAIALDDPERGPFLVVTREGRFVTCLGAGMRTGDLPVITRGQLDGLTAKVADLRARMAAANALAGPRGHTAQLLDRIFHAGPDLSREEFVGISAFRPLFGFEFLRAFFGSVTELDELRGALLRIEHPKRTLTPVLRRYWDLFWAVGHLAALAFMDGRALIESLPEELDLSTSCLAWGASRQGSVALALRGFRGVAKIGKAQLRACKTAFDEAASPLRLVTSVGSLIALGVGHARLRAEVRKVLSAPRDLSGAHFHESLLTLFRTTADVVFDEPESAAAVQRELGSHMAVALTRRLAAGDPLRFEREEDVPEALAMTLAVNTRQSFVDDAEVMALTMLFVPWAVRAEPEQLYLPRELIRVVHTRWTPEATMQLLAPLREHYHPKKAQAPRREGPSRKGPCPCGSGEKYKRCCGKSA